MPPLFRRDVTSQFIYKDARLQWEPGKGYRNLVTTEWESSPVDAVMAYVQDSPHQREDFLELARRIQAFWIANAKEEIPPFDEVCFDL